MFLIVRPLFDAAILWLILSLFASRKWEEYDFQEVIKVAAVIAIAGFVLGFFLTGSAGILTIAIQGALAVVAMMHFLHVEQQPAVKVAAIFIGVKLAMALAILAMLGGMGGGEIVE